MRYCALLVNPRPQSPRYLATVVGRYLNCLSSSHRKMDYRLPIRCFNCHMLRHYLRDCRHPPKFPALLVLGGYETRSDVGGRHLVQDRCVVSCARPASQAMRNTLPPPRDGGNSDGLVLGPFSHS
jgi:hypothetical protein